MSIRSHRQRMGRSGMAGPLASPIAARGYEPCTHTSGGPLGHLLCVRQAILPHLPKDPSNPTECAHTHAQSAEQ
eukprot:356968-Chlamydomonas_euryale.AAC.27